MSKTQTASKGVSLNPDAFVDNDDPGEADDIKKYLVPTQDDKGHSMEMRLHLPKSFGARINKILASGKCPFWKYGPHQAARYFIRRGMEEFEKDMKGLDLNIDSLTNAEEMLALAQEGEDFRRRMARFASEIERMVSDGEEDEARSLISGIYERTKTEPKVWRRKRQLKAIEDRFGHLIKKEK